MKKNQKQRDKICFRNDLLSSKIPYSSDNIVGLPFFTKKQKPDVPYKAIKKFLRPIYTYL